MRTPASKAADLVYAIESETVPEGWAELGIDPLVDPLVVFFVSHGYSSPIRPFGADVAASRASRNVMHREWWDAQETVIGWLRSGDEPTAVARKLRRMQKWAWGAIALDAASLAAELASRYELSEAEPETDLRCERIPGGLLVSCSVLIRGHEF